MPKKLWEPGFPFQPARAPFFYGWVIVAAASIGIVFSIPGQTMGFSVFTNTLMAELNLTRVQLSTAYCVGTVLSGFTLPMLGVWFDRLGARRMVVYTSVATGLILFYLSWVKGLLDLISPVGASSLLPRTVVAFALITLGFYLVRASAQGVLTMTSRNVIGKWFDYHRGIALAASGTLTSFAFSIAPAVLNRLVEGIGYVRTWQLLGVLTIGAMSLLGWLFFRDNPEECGLVMDGTTVAASDHKENADMTIYRDYNRGEALRTWPFWAFNLSFAFFSLFATAFTFHIESIGDEGGRSSAEIFGYFIPMAIASVATNVLIGWLSARTRLRYLLLAMNLAALTGVIGLIHISSPLGLLAYIAGNGVCGGCFSALSGIVWPRFFGRVHLGAISGVSMSSMVIASGFGPLAFSISKAITQSYALALWLCAIIPAVMAVGSLGADNPQRRSK
ncbi:MAG: MFS transporter [Verrucomicrobiae bacterium]|nr:MFS transporter [Verrucomicrobiae bacterium]